MCVQSEKYASWVNLKPQLDRCCQGEAEVYILNSKTTWSGYQMTNQTAPAEAKLSCKSSLVCVKSEKYACWVTLRPQWNRCRRGEAEVRIINFKTTWSEFQMPSQTAPAKAKPRCVYSILKPHGQSFITSPESVQSSCALAHLGCTRAAGTS